MLLVQLHAACRSRVTLARIDAAEIDLTWRRRRSWPRPAHRSSRQRLPSTSTLRGFRRRPSTARFIASMVACRMLSVSISSTLACADASSTAPSSRISSYRRSRCSGVSTFESSRPRIALACRRGSPPRRPPARPAARGPLRRRPPSGRSGPVEDAGLSCFSASRTFSMASVASCRACRGAAASMQRAESSLHGRAFWQRGSSSQSNAARGERLGGGVVLQQFRHDESPHRMFGRPTQGW